MLTEKFVHFGDFRAIGKDYGIRVIIITSKNLPCSQSTNVIVGLSRRGHADVERVDAGSVPINVLWLLDLENAPVDDRVKSVWYLVQLLAVLT